MEEAIIGKKYLILNKKVGTGAFDDLEDSRDYSYDEVAMGAAEVDWEKGYDVEKDLKITVPIKDQDGSSSCVGQAWAYYTAVINAKEVGYYKEMSAKGFYSQIFLPGGGAYLREGAKLAVNWGSILESIVSSYEPGGVPPQEKFFTNLTWLDAEKTEQAKIYQAKEYRTINASQNMNLFATAIRDNLGVVGGVYGSNNGTWGSYEPKPPTSRESKWGHALFFGKFGTDAQGKYIATPNSWGKRGGNMTNYPDGWQKLREDYFSSGNMFAPWTLLDKPNIGMDAETKNLVTKYEKKIIIEAEGAGRKGIIVNGKMLELTKDREATACLYALANNGLGVFVKSDVFNKIEKNGNF